MSNALKRIGRVTGTSLAARPRDVTALRQGDSKGAQALDAERPQADAAVGLPTAVPAAGDGTALVGRGWRAPADGTGTPPLLRRRRAPRRGWGRRAPAGGYGCAARSG